MKKWMSWEKGEVWESHGQMKWMRSSTRKSQVERKDSIWSMDVMEAKIVYNTVFQPYQFSRYVDWGILGIEICCWSWETLVHKSESIGTITVNNFSVNEI